jgi:1,4-alpha-glucan branching enzyme
MSHADLQHDFARLAGARHHDPFSILGRHREGGDDLIRAYLPHADAVRIAEGDLPLERIADTDLFEWRGRPGTVPEHYHLAWSDAGQRYSAHDPYCFPPQLSEFDLHLLGEGRHRHAYRILGAHVHVVDAIPGVLFAVWAPNAERVSVVGDFNHWDGRRHPMRVRGASGIWELFLPELEPGTLYKYEIRNRESGEILLKSDPYAQAFELRH